MPYLIEELKPGDWSQVVDIYQQGMQTGLATFESRAPSWEEWDAGHLKIGRIVARSHEGQVLGWVALSPTSSRYCYRGVVELSVYVDVEHKGQGIGRALLEEEKRCCDQNGLWTIEAKIIAENNPSIRLHTSCGFRVVGTREKVGKMPGGTWHDVVLMEHRSKAVCLADDTLAQEGEK